MPDKKLPAVPETILKRRKRQAAARAECAKATSAAKTAAHAKRKEVFLRAGKYVKQYREKERDEIRLKREAKKNNGYVDRLRNRGLFRGRNGFFSIHCRFASKNIDLFDAALL